MLEIYETMQDLKKIKAANKLSDEISNLLRKGNFIEVVNGHVRVDEYLYLDEKEIKEAIFNAVERELNNTQN